MSSSVDTLVSDTTASTSAYDISSILTASSGTSTAAIDVNAAVSSALYSLRGPERVWQDDQTTLSSQKTALTSIQTATEALATDMQNLNTLSGPLSARTATSSNSNYLTATAATGTATGTHTVVVNSLATTAGWYSGVESSPTAKLATSSFTITTAAGDSVTFQTGSDTTGDTLNNLAKAINSATTSSGDSLGITATVMSDSTGSRLAITSNTSGASSDFSISEPYTSWTAPQMTSGETLAANSITLNLNGTSVTVKTTSGESYADLAKSINELSANNYTTTDNSTEPPTTTTGTYVTATATTDSNGNTNFSIVSTDGTTTFSINEPSSSDTTFAFTQSAQGADASITVDGVPAQYASNTVKGAISGVTLSLLGAAPGSQIGLTIASDASKVSTAINQFVTDYNTALGLVNAQFKFSTTTDSSGNTSTGQGVLGSDPTLVSFQATLEQALSYVATPAEGTSTSVSTLRDLGITVANDGTLSVDSSTLNNALAANPSDVQNFFEGASLNGFANSVYSALNSYTSSANGAFTVDLRSISSTNSSLTTKINDFESGYIASQKTILTASYTAAETALQSLSTTMAQINALLGNTSSSS
jgi:flagellar hook-associated protein 2